MPLPPFRILVVDDHPDSADVLTQFLQMEELDARAAYSGADAVAKTAEWLPHLIFMDISMPSMDGHEAFNRIRSMGLNVIPYIVALTAWSHGEERKRIEVTGFDGHLVKPAKLDLILAMINVLRKRKSIDG